MSRSLTDLPFESVVTRVDSDRTDESPFGSKLTTPIDENVQLFASTINQRLSERKYVEMHSDGVVESFGSQSAEHKFLEIMGGDDKASRSGDYPIAPTPSPSLESTDVFVSSQDRLVPASRSRSASIYSQPNVPLRIAGETSEDEQYPFIDPDISSFSESGAVNSSGDVSLSGSGEKLILEDPARTAKSLFSLLPFAADEFALLLDDTTTTLASDSSNDFPLPQLSLDNIFPILLRILVFPLWCALAGATILAFPHSLDLLLFRWGFATPPASPIHRFALFTDIAPQLVKIFLAALVVLWCMYPTLSLIIAGGVATLMMIAWVPFKVDKRIPLGANDQQALYLVWEAYKYGDDRLRLKENRTGFLAIDTEDSEMNGNKGL